MIKKVIIVMIISVKSKYDNDDNDGDGYEIIIKFVKKSFFFSFLLLYFFSFTHVSSFFDTKELPPEVVENERILR